jgi:hypothetical protein
VASVVALGALCLLALGSGGKKKEGSEGTTSSTDTPATKAAAKPVETAAPAAMPKVGELVKFDDSEWTVVETKDMGQKLASNNQFQEPAKTDGRYIYVKFKVKNLTNKEERIMDHPKVVDSQGREFGAFDHETFYLPKGVKSMSLEALPSSMQKEFGAIYEVPADAKTLTFEARSLAMFGTDKKKIALGL